MRHRRPWRHAGPAFSATVLLVETKGDDRDNTDSERKLRLGQAWEKKAGDRFKYFMVFQTVEVPRAFTQNKFASIAGRL